MSTEEEQSDQHAGKSVHDERGHRPVERAALTDQERFGRGLPGPEQSERLPAAASPSAAPVCEGGGHAGDPENPDDQRCRCRELTGADAVPDGR